MTNKPELLPCPFCGSEDVNCGSVGWEWFSYCNKCNVRNHEHDSEEKAIAAWNTRAPLGVTKAEAVRMVNGALDA